MARKPLPEYDSTPAIFQPSPVLMGLMMPVQNPAVVAHRAIPAAVTESKPRAIINEMRIGT